MKVQPGQWRFSLNGISIIVLADARANRMLIVAFVVNANELTTEQVQNMLRANLHATLDARYGVSNRFVVSIFIHPFDSLSEKDMLSELDRVASLVDTFGTTYSSGKFLFVPGGRREKESAPSEENMAI